MLSFNQGSRRNTKCYEIHIAGAGTFYISYQTVIACATEEGRCRLHNSWGPTTGRHMNDMGIRDWPEVETSELQARIRKAIMKAGLEQSLKPFHPN